MLAGIFRINALIILKKILSEDKLAIYLFPGFLPLSAVQ